MIIKMHPCLREQANLAFSRFTRKTADLTQIKDLFAAAVKNHRGIAISEACHGRYAYPLLMADMMPIWAQKNVARFYTEMVPASKQALLDKWQDSGDDKGITDYFDAEFEGYSKKMWAHYWLMLQAAHENGIRVVGVDNPEIRSGYGPAVDAPFKTMHWEGIISKDLRNLAPDQRYVVYGGESHLVDMGGALRGIHQYLEIPRVLMREGPYTIASHPLDKKPSFEVRIPQASRQDPISNRRDVRNNPVKWTV
jgi:hypothetical protein